MSDPDFRPPPIDLPYQFARRHGVLIRGGDDGVEVIHRDSASTAALVELRRVIGCPFRLRPVEDGAFAELLDRGYRDSAAAAAEVAGAAENQPDLASLAESVTETEDLLEQRDDAPIVRLIPRSACVSPRRVRNDLDKSLMAIFARIDALPWC